MKKKAFKNKIITENRKNLTAGNKFYKLYLLLIIFKQQVI